VFEELFHLPKDRDAPFPLEEWFYFPQTRRLPQADEHRFRNDMF